ncbi:class I SAM-dependent methyltransferase [Rhizobium bangladeshense]|uniref:class I SAM-dependent methyltransferase n=1 Tax=Rhizobium bangladeshense TaxID=1138189 RepID=UPI001C82CA57|nr:class I SAM-dependent methyltransferase [Rhizobium bangladeshense]MBX4898708.1 methyltransferase domain-containing protein [Rhizobium bangladeshense]MBY3616731.1 methyltransferase regulatory domain-containing protein [Rhizobium bangladeshense]
MTAWTSGYVSGIDYTHGFYRELTPSQLMLAALCAGQKLSGFEGRLRYCELGCGQGYSTNLLASANPHIDFYANDFNPSHIAGARSLAERAAIGNVHFYEHDFAAFLDEKGLPEEFDIIVLHGILSWVSDSIREDVLRFVQRKLRSGGMVFASYNTLPGWASAMPLRRLLIDRASRTPAPIAGRIDDALDFVRGLASSDAAYFKANPNVQKRLQGLGSMARSYLAHEFFNRDWSPFYFADVAELFAGAKLSYAGSLNFVDAVDAYALTAPQKAILDAESDPILREGIRDVIVNEQFRTDLFIRGPLAHSFRSACGVWLETRFVLSSPIDTVFANIRGRRGNIELDAALYGPMLELFAEGPTSVKGILTTGRGQGTTWEKLTETIAILVGAGHLQPCLFEDGEDGLDAREKSCARFNKVVCEAAFDSEDMQFLASPVSGGGLMLNRFEQLFLLARGESQSEEEWPRVAWDILKPQGFRLTRGGTLLVSDEDNLRELKMHRDRFLTQRLPVCDRLGIRVSSSQVATHQVATQ